MKTTLSIVALSLCFLLTGCSFAYKQRPLVAVAFTGRAQKLDYPTIDSLFDAVSVMLRSEGFNGGNISSSRGYYLTGERFYAAGFGMKPSIGCSVEIDRKSVCVRFYEMEIPRKSNVFPATEQDRLAVRALATRIEHYLRAHLPPSFQIRVSIEEKRA